MSDMTVRDAVLSEYPHTLKLPGLAREYPSLARQTRDGGWAYEEFLRCALEAELQSRQESVAAHRLREARFPDIKTLDQLDWKALQGVSRPKLLELSSCEYLNKAEDVILAGPIGTGKTHVAIALGVEAIQAGYTVLYISAFDLAQDLNEAQATGTRRELIGHLMRTDLLVLEDLGMRHLPPTAAEDLLEVFVRRYEKGAIIVTSNRPLEDWGKMLGDTAAAGAILDRFLHHADIIKLEGRSYRMHDRRALRTESANNTSLTGEVN